MTTLYDLSVPIERSEGISEAAVALRHGRLVIVPTDTVYGLAADAFNADAVRKLLNAKGRGRSMPPPVLVSAKTTVEALAIDVPAWARALMESFWPGPLTLVLRQQPSLQWDLGDSFGTVAVRMPNHEAVLELIGRTGPLAVSSANRTGRPAADNAQDAKEMLGDFVKVILDDGPSGSQTASSIIDATTSTPRLLRAGSLSIDELNDVLGPHDARLEDEEPSGPA